MEGYYDKISLRSVPSQQKPYVSIDEVVKRQSLFEYQDKEAIMVGYFFPEYLKGLTYPGLHIHFVTKDLQHGGHVLDFHLKEGSLFICPIETYVYQLPDYARNAHGFEILKLAEIVAVIDPCNIASLKLIQKCGLKYWKKGLYMGRERVIYRISQNMFKN